MPNYTFGSSLLSHNENDVLTVMSNKQIEHVMHVPLNVYLYIMIDLTIRNISLHPLSRHIYLYGTDGLCETCLAAIETISQMYFSNNRKQVNFDIIERAVVFERHQYRE